MESFSSGISRCAAGLLFCAGWLLAVMAHPSMAFAQGGKASQRVVLAFYNLENLFDTIPSSGDRDREYTPDGTRAWNSERYRIKLTNMARVLDSLRADVVGLAEVENERVLRDLVATLHTDYNYMYPGKGDQGMGVALLYRGSLFVPLAGLPSGAGYPRGRVLAVRGKLGGDTLTLVVAHLPSLLNPARLRREAAAELHAYLNRLLERDPSARVILMGDLNMTPSSLIARHQLSIRPMPETADALLGPFFFYTPFARLEQQGYGSYVYRDRRYLYDFMAFSPGWLQLSGERPDSRWRFGNRCGIFSPGFLVRQEGLSAGYPLRTFEGNRYLGGFSDHLPVYLILER